MVSAMMLLGLVGLVGGGINYFTFPLGLKMGLRAFINLEKNGMVYPIYMDPPFHSNSTYYLYEVTNPREVLRGSKMEFKLRGPYIFKTYMKRSNIEFKQNNEILKFDTMRKSVLDERRSANDIDERFWFLNPTLPSLQAQVKSIVLDKVPFQRVSEPIVFNTINVLLDNFKERLIVKRSPRELLDGQKIDLLDFLTGVANRLGLGSLVPPGPPNNVFGLIYAQNEKVDTLEVWTGSGDSKRFADIHSWNGKQKVDVWSGNCQIMEGTNGELYKPYISEPKPIKVFFAQLCRTFYMEPVGGELVDAAHGIKAYEYQPSPRLFQGTRTNPRNKCFCKNPKTYDCQYDGLIPMGPCFFDAPLYFAKGNFKDVDRKIKGTIADETAVDESRVSAIQSFYLEPLTGTILRVNLTLVGIFKFIKQPYMRDLANVRNVTYAPLFVTTETIVVPYEVARPMKYLQLMNDNYKPASLLVAAGGSGLLIMKLLGSMFF